MTPACDERSPNKGGEKEEPNEPPLLSLGRCRMRIIRGVKFLDRIEGDLKEPFYRYNSLISKYGYMVKPVHKVYKEFRRGFFRMKKIYIYYGRYWWKRQGKKLIYVGTEKPPEIPFDPPPNDLEGHSIIREGPDIIIDCSLYEKYKDLFKDHEVRLEY